MMKSLSRAEVRDVDRRAISLFGVPGVVLMENAGAGVARLLESLDIRGPVIIACGKGNNGGDGFVIARHLDSAGYPVQLLLACPPEQIGGDAAVNLQIAQRAGLPIEQLANGNLEEWQAALAGADWVIDALLGTGASGPPTGTVAVAIAAINAIRDQTAARVLAVDLPSGLDCDTGQTAGACIRADHTATFVAPKQGFDSAGAATYTGRVEVIGIGAPRPALPE